MKDGALKDTAGVLFTFASVIILFVCFPIGVAWGLVRVGFGAGNEWIENRTAELVKRHIKPKGV